MKKLLVTFVLGASLVLLVACGKEEPVKEVQGIAKEEIEKEDFVKQEVAKQKETDKPNNKQEEASETDKEKPVAGFDAPDDYSKAGIGEVKMWEGIHFRIADVDVFEMEDTDYISYTAGKSARLTIKAYHDDTTSFEEFISVPLDGFESETVSEVTFEDDGVKQFSGQYKTTDGSLYFNRLVYRVDNMFYDVVYAASQEEYNTYLPDVSYTVESITFDREFTKKGSY